MKQSLGGRYRLDDEVGQGTIGTVYRATDELLTRTVALKVVDRDLSSDEGSAARIKQAGGAIARLTHPNLVTVFDVTTLDERLCIVTEFVDGPPFSQIIEDGGLTADKVARLGRDLAAALGTAHAAGVVHGHLHPQNVLLTSKGVPKLVDVGLSRTRVVESSTDVTQEEWMAEDESITPASDVFSLALMLRAAVSDTDRRRAGDLLDVLDAATRHDPTARLADGAALAAALRTVAGSSSSGAFVPTLRRPAEVEETAVLDVVPDEQSTAPLTTSTDDPARTRVMAVHSGRETTADRPATDDTAPRPAGPRQDHPPTDAVEEAETAPSGPTPWLGRILGGAAVLVVLVLVAGQLFAGGSGNGQVGGGEAGAIAIAGASDFDPLGGGSEHPESVGESYDGRLETAWTTEGYDQPDLGGIKSGVGIVYDLGAARQVSQIRASFISEGSDVEIYAFDEAPGSDPGTWGSPQTSLSATSANDVIEVDGEGRYWLVWFTHLGPYEGRYRAGIGEIVFEGR